MRILSILLVGFVFALTAYSAEETPMNPGAVILTRKLEGLCRPLYLLIALLNSETLNAIIFFLL
jgi:hypothetical protein